MRIRIALLVGLLTAGAFALAGGSAAAHTKTFATQLVPVADGSFEDDFVFIGRLQSGQPRCRANRRVTMTFLYPDGSSRLRDRGTSSNSGTFTLGGNLVNPPNPQAALIEAPRRRIAPITKQHRHFCARGFFFFG